MADLPFLGCWCPRCQAILTASLSVPQPPPEPDVIRLYPTQSASAVIIGIAGSYYPSLVVSPSDARWYARGLLLAAAAAERYAAAKGANS